MKVIKENFLLENALKNIISDISNSLPNCIIKKSSKQNYLIITTPKNEEYAIPIEEVSSYSSKDYKTLRFTGNGIVKNGILTDSDTGIEYPCYIGVPTRHNHYDYSDDVKIYHIEKGSLNDPISLNDFMTGINSGRF